MCYKGTMRINWGPFLSCSFLINWQVFVQKIFKFFSQISDPPKTIVHFSRTRFLETDFSNQILQTRFLKPLFLQNKRSCDECLASNLWVPWFFPYLEKYIIPNLSYLKNETKVISNSSIFRTFALIKGRMTSSQKKLKFRPLMRLEMCTLKITQSIDLYACGCCNNNVHHLLRFWVLLSLNARHNSGMKKSTALCKVHLTKSFGELKEIWRKGVCNPWCLLSKPRP